VYRRLILHAPVVFVAMHLALWIAVVVVWTFTWRSQPEPMGPPFNFAAGFIKGIDFAVSPLVSNLAVGLALKSQSWVGVDLGFAYTLLFACLMLVLGSLQWFLIGRLIQWLGAKRWVLALLSISGAACWVLFCFLAWSRYWANW
jgi:hypothetical protein